MKIFLQKLFSVKNNDNHKVWTIFGIKIKFLNSHSTLTSSLLNIINTNNEINNRIINIQDEIHKIDRKQRMSWQGIIDSSPNSFKSYALENNMPQEIELLKRNLDKKSLSVIDISLKKIMQLPDCTYAKCLYIDEDEFRKNFETDEDKKFNRLFDENINSARENYNLSKDTYDMELFIYHHGLRFTNQKIKDYVKNKDFIDAGAYIGDSALVFMEYLPNKIYSFEISDSSIDYYKKTMDLNKIPTSKYELIECALSDKEDVVNVIDNGEMDVKIYNNKGYKKLTTSLDFFLKDKNCNIGFIKADIEGAMYKALIGMQETIKKHRPVLSFAIYHSPEEFFKTKPLLEEITKDLNYKIEIDCHFSQCFHIYGTIIWAYPKELED